MSVQSSKRRREFWLLFGACVLVLLLVPVVRHYQLRATARAYVAQLQAQGEKLDLAQVLPPAVPPEQDSSALLLQAVALLDKGDNVLSTNPPLAMHMVAPGRAQIGWQQPAIVNRTATNSWTEVEAALAQDDAALTLLRQISSPAVFDFNLPYEQGIEKIPMAHLMSPRKAAQRLYAAVMDELQRGDAETAAHDVRVLLALVHGMAHDRMFLSELVRIANTHLAVGVSWELLQSPNVTESELAPLQQAWSDLEFIRPGEKAMLLERAGGRMQLAKWRSSNATLFDDLGYSGTGWDDFLSFAGLRANLRRIKYGVDILRWRYWWSYADEMRTLQGEQALLETFRQARTNASLLALAQEQDKELQSILSETNTLGAGSASGNPTAVELRDLMSSSVQSLERFFGKTIQAETARRMALTAIALKRFQLHQGHFPETLATLTPEYLPAVSIDPMSGQAFHYRRDGADGFLLYSVGKDGVDDGGDASNTSGSNSTYWLKGRDWVWPQPAR